MLIPHLLKHTHIHLHAHMHILTLTSKYTTHALKKIHPPTLPWLRKCWKGCPSGLLVHRIMKSRVQFLPWRIAQHSILSHKHLLLQTSNSNSWKPGRRCMAGQEAFLSAAIFSLFLILLQVCIACVLTIFEKKMGKKT